MWWQMGRCFSCPDQDHLFYPSKLDDCGRELEPPPPFLLALAGAPQRISLPWVTLSSLQETPNALGTSRSPAATPSPSGKTAPSTRTCRTSPTGMGGCGSTRRASTTSTPKSTSATPAMGPAPGSPSPSSCSASTGRPPTASPSSCSKGSAPSAGHPRRTTGSTRSTREDCLS